MKEKEAKLKESAASLLKEARQKSGLSQGDVAKITELKVSNISRIESGSQNLSLDTIEKYCYALNLEAELVVEEQLPWYNSSEYSLRIYNQPLLKFSMKRNGHDISVKINCVNEESINLLPVSLKADDESLRLWIKKRHLPGNRAYVYEILKSIGLEKNDIKGLVDISRCLSLEDSYWIKADEDDSSFEDVNLFENSFSSQVGMISFMGMYQPCSRKETSPEYTTGGMLRKAWRRLPDREGIWLYKGGSEGGSGYPGLEPYSEYYAYQIAKAMGLNAISYDLDLWKGILSSYCALFTTKDISYVPISDFSDITEIEDVIEFYKKLGSKFYDELCDMLVFDALILNKDRHFGNCGLLRDNRTGEFIAPAPIFDNGLSLFAQARRDDFIDLNYYAAKQNNPYERTWEDILSLALGKRQKDQLKMLKGFHFTEHSEFNLPEWRLKEIENFLRKRIEEILR